MPEKPRRKIPLWQIGFLVVLFAVVILFVGRGGRGGLLSGSSSLHVRCEIHGVGEAAQVRCAATNQGDATGRVRTNIILHCADGPHQTLLQTPHLEPGQTELVTIPRPNPPLTDDSLECESELTGWEWRHSRRRRLAVRP